MNKWTAALSRKKGSARHWSVPVDAPLTEGSGAHRDQRAFSNNKTKDHTRFKKILLCPVIGRNEPGWVGWGGRQKTRKEGRKDEGRGGGKLKRHHFALWQSDWVSLFNPTGPHQAACFYTLIKTIIHDPSSVFLLVHMNPPSYTHTHQLSLQHTVVQFHVRVPSCYFLFIFDMHGTVQIHK